MRIIEDISCSILHQANKTAWNNCHFRVEALVKTRSRRECRRISLSIYRNVIIIKLRWRHFEKINKYWLDRFEFIHLCFCSLNSRHLNSHKNKLITRETYSCFCKFFVFAILQTDMTTLRIDLSILTIL